MPYQVCVQPNPSTANTALPAYAAVRCAAALLLLGAGAQQQTRRTSLLPTLDRFTDSARVRGIMRKNFANYAQRF